MTKKKPSLRFVTAINFELTHACNLSCSHCLQREVRKQGKLTWLNTESAISCLKEGEKLGFTSSGVNFTGGEPFLPESNLPELLVAADSLELPVRINTNGWWGGHKNIKIGREVFLSSRELVKWLKNIGVEILALSIDQRYETDIDLLNSVSIIVNECESVGLYYQFIHTRSLQSNNDRITEELTLMAGGMIDYMIPVEMEMVDVGAASSLKDISSDSQMYCQGKGFYRPIYLHVNPNGGVRTCMYAPGAGWLGNINKESLEEISDKFANNPVVDFFSSCSGSKKSLIEKNNFQSESDLPRHPCAFAGKIAQKIEEQKSGIN